MNPLNRRMFRQPGASRRPTGILASSPQLANTVANRQPVQMAHGGYHAPGSRDANERKFREELNRGLIPDLFSGTGDLLSKYAKMLPRSGFARPMLDRTVSGILTAVPKAGDILKERRAIQSGVLPGREPDFELPSRVVSEEDSPALRLLASEILGGRRDAQFMGEKRDPNLDVDIGLGDQGGVEPPPIEDQVVLPRRVVSEEDSSEEGAVKLKSLIPIPKSKPEREASKENLMGTDQDAQFYQDPLNIVDMVAAAQNDPENKTEKDKAKATDSVLNIKSIKERKKFLRELLGESKAKDIRTDANYNLMMTGLLIAAGQSPDALVNIAKGLAGGLKGYGDAVGEEAKEERKIDRELGILAYQDVEKREAADRAAAAAEKSEIRKIEAAATEADKQRVFLTSQNALSFLNKKELAQLGFANQLKIAELSRNSRELIAELGRENQMEIAQLPSKEIQGLLDIFDDDKEAVKAYLERKKSTSGPQAKSGERKADDLEELITKDESRISRIRSELKKRNGRKPTEAEIQAEIRKIARAGIAEFLPDPDDGNTSDTSTSGFTVTKKTK